MRLLIVAGAALLLGSASLYIWGFESNSSSFFSSFILAPIGLADLGLLVLAAASFVLTRSSLSRAHGRSIAVAFLAIGALFAFTGAISTTGAVACLGPCGNNRGLPLIEGTITVTPGSNDGTLVLQFQGISNDARSFTNITLTDQLGGGAATFSNTSSFDFMYQGSPVSTANPLPSNQTATGSMRVANATVGVTYVLEVTSISQDNYHTVQPVDITALA
jgi:hypothetical protein